MCFRYVLNTTVEGPHEDYVHTLQMRPLSTSASPDRHHMAVTSSRDGKFKLWNLVDDTDIYSRICLMFNICTIEILS